MKQLNKQRFEILETVDAGVNEIHLAKDLLTDEYVVIDYTFANNATDMREVYKAFDQLTAHVQPTTLQSLVGKTFGNEYRLELAIKKVPGYADAKVVPVLDGFYVEHKAGITKVLTTTTIGKLRVEGLK